MLYRTCVSTASALWTPVKRTRLFRQPTGAIGSVEFKLNFSLELFYSIFLFLIIFQPCGFFIPCSWEFWTRLQLLSLFLFFFILPLQDTVGGRTHLNFLKRKRLQGWKKLTTASLVSLIPQGSFLALCGITLKNWPPLLLSQGGLIHCFCLMRGVPSTQWEGGGGVWKDTDRHCLVFSFSSVPYDAVLRVRTRSPSRWLNCAWGQRGYWWCRKGVSEAKAKTGVCGWSWMDWWMECFGDCTLLRKNIPCDM